MKKWFFIIVSIYLLGGTLAAFFSTKLFCIFIAMGVLSVLWGVGLLLVNRQVKKTNWYRNSIPDKENYPGNDWYRKHIERNFDIANIGSSSAKYAFNYTDCPVKAFNWGEQPQSLTNGFKVLKCYFSILKKNGKVIISLGPFSGLSVDGKWNESLNDKYYYILCPTLIDNLRRVSLRRRYPLLFLPFTSLKRLIKDIPAKQFNNRGCQCTDFNKDAAKWVENWKAEFDIEDLNASLSAENKAGQLYRIQLLQEIIDFCLERDLQPVLVIPPLHPALSRLLTDTFRKNYIFHFIEQANTKQVPFYNCMDDQHFQEDKYYYNAFLMNEEGAKLFTSSLLAKL